MLRSYRGAKPIDIRMVQIHLCHRSLKITQRYTHVSQFEVAEVVRSRLGEIFQGSGKMTELAQMHESGHRTDGAVRIRVFQTELFMQIFENHFGYFEGIV